MEKLYPSPKFIRSNWDNLSSFSSCGIFDLDMLRNRIPENDLIASIRRQQKLVAHLKNE